MKSQLTDPVNELVPPVKPEKRKPPVASESTDVADMIIAYLEQMGVEYVFGVPGGAIEPLYNAMARNARAGGKLRPVVARHESGAAFMADGYARETGKLGVCIATSGPGATNMITGIACAYDNCVPMLAITGQPSLPMFGRRALQESSCTGINTVGMLRHCTRFNSLVSHREQAETKLLSALMRAKLSPVGPVHLSIPVDILRSPVKSLGGRLDLHTLTYVPSMIDDVAIRELAEKVRHTKNMAMVIGGGCGEAIEAIVEFAERTNTLFVTTPDGKGLVNPRHPLYRGVFGFAGHYMANAVLLDEPDIVLAIGTSLGEWVSAAWCNTVLNDRLVHIDASEEHLERSPMAMMHVRGRISSVFERLLEMLDPQQTPVPIRSAIDQLTMLREPDKFQSDAVPIKPQRLMRELSRRCPPNSCFVADAGNSTPWAIHYLELQSDRRALSQQRIESRPNSRRRTGGWLRVVMDFAPMGWAIGAAVGIAFGNRGNPVICLTGDGSYLMNGQEITVALEANLTVIFVILNDSALGMVKHGQRLAGAEPICHTLPTIDYTLQAQSMGIPGHIIRSADDFDAIDFPAILRRQGPTLLDIRIDGEEVPPMNLRMKTLGTVK